MQVSPNYLMILVDKIEKVMWEKYETYNNVLYYIEKWHIIYDSFNDAENFRIYQKGDGKIDLKRTLHGIDSKDLLRIAIDLGIETPDFIPSIPVIKNELKASYNTAYNVLDKATKQCRDNPDEAVSLANSALESVIKTILDSDYVDTKWNPKDTLYSLTQSLLKEISLYPKSDIPEEINTIGSKLLCLSQHIEKLRSEKTNAHGKLADDYIIDDPIYAEFIINSVSTITIFLISYFQKKFVPTEAKQSSNEADTDDIPF